MLAALVAAVFSSTADAQSIDLHVAAPPELGAFTYGDSRIGILEGEVAKLVSAERAASDTQRILLRAMINLRLIAIDLFTAGDRAGDAGSPAIVHAHRLQRGRIKIDAAITSLFEFAADMDVDAGAAERVRTALDGLAQFNALAAKVDLADDVKDAAGLDARLASVCSPLGEALCALTGEPRVNHWVAPTAEAMGRDGAPVDRAADPAALRERVMQAPLRDVTRAELIEVVSYLERGRDVPEFKPLVVPYAQVVRASTEFAAALHDARAWLGEPLRARYADLLHSGVALFREPQTRERGRRRIERLAASGAVVSRITRLARVDEPPDAAPLREALAAADAMIDTPADAAVGQRQVERLRPVVERMITYRTLPPAEGRGLPKEAAAGLREAYERAEAALLARLAEFAADPDAFADPADVTLLASQQQCLADLQRVRRVPVWIERIGAVRPSAMAGFARQARRMAMMLLDPNRRPEASRALDQFEQQLALFYPLPFESELRSATPWALELTGGRHMEVLRAIDAHRGAWADDWARGVANGEAAHRMLALHRLMRAMADLEAVLELGEDAALLNRWTLWELGGRSVARSIADLPNRVKFAAAALADDNASSLKRELDRIDRDLPVAKLLGRLGSVIGEEVTALPGGAVGVVNQVVVLPGADAWMLAQRGAFTRLCRYALERDHAAAAGRSELAEALRVYIDGLAKELLADLGEAPTVLPALIGFDAPAADADGSPQRR